VDAFVAYLKRYSQLNGGFHHKVGIKAAAEGIARIISYDSFSPHHIASKNAATHDDQLSPLAAPVPA
jgi:hypothetical protein